MTCHYFEGAGFKGYVCMNDWGRLHLGNRYVWVDFHEYCGPTFFKDQAMTELYDPVDENDPIWPLFDRWLEKNRARKAKR